MLKVKVLNLNSEDEGSLTAKRISISFAATLLAIIVACFFIAQIYEQQNFNYSLISRGQTQVIQDYSIVSLQALAINQYVWPAAYPSTSTFQAPNISQTYLANSTRSQIFNYINQNPGVQFRAICSTLCLPIGLAEYHLGVLVRSGLVSFVRDGRYKRFFVSNRFSQEEMALICVLRHKTAKKIIEILLNKKGISHCRLAEEVSISSQALTWQMNTLKNTSYILRVNDGLRTIYSLNESSTPMIGKYMAVVQ